MKASWNILRRGIFQKEGATSRQLLYVEEAGANIPRRKALLRIQSGQKAFTEMEKGRICVENFIGELFFKALGLLWYTIHVLRIGQKLKKRNTIGDPWYLKCLRQLLQMECFPPAPLTSLSYPGKIASPVYHVASYSYRVSQKKVPFWNFRSTNQYDYSWPLCTLVRDCIGPFG